MPETGGRVALRIGVDDEYATAKERERRAEIDGRRAFSDAAFLIDECDDASQRRYPAESKYCSSNVSSKVRSLRSGSSVTCSNNQRSASPTRSSPAKPACASPRATSAAMTSLPPIVNSRIENAGFRAIRRERALQRRSLLPSRFGRPLPRCRRAVNRTDVRYLEARRGG